MTIKDSDSQTITLGRAEKVLAVVMLIGGVVFSVGGNYMVTSFRLSNHEERITKTETKVEQMEAIGHPDHERRITKLESRADGQEHAISEVQGKLDVAVAILQRIEKQIDQRTNP